MISLYWPDRLWRGGVLKRDADGRWTNGIAPQVGVWVDGDEFADVARWIGNAVPANDKEEHGAFTLAKINGGRRVQNVKFVTALGLDGDETGVDARAIFDLLEGYERVVYTTFTSTPTAPRWRAILELSRRATGAEHYRYVGNVHANLRASGINLDPQAVDPCRLWYIPAFKYRENFECHIGHGAKFDVDVALATADELDAERLAEREARARARPATRAPVGCTHTRTLARARAYVAKMEPGVEGAFGSRATFNVARKLVRDFELEDDDALTLLREFNMRCSPPWSDKELERKVAQARDKSRIGNPMGAL